MQNSYRNVQAGRGKKINIKPRQTKRANDKKQKLTAQHKIFRYIHIFILVLKLD